MKSYGIKLWNYFAYFANYFYLRVILGHRNKGGDRNFGDDSGSEKG